MAQLFETQPGRVVAVANALDVPLYLRLEGWSGFFGQGAILTDLSFELDGNAQFRHTAQDLTFVYVFGDRISRLQVAGLAFAGACDGGGTTGLEQVLDFYNANRVAARLTPCQLQLGAASSGSFRGFLVGLRVQASRPEARIVQFSLAYAVIPRLRGT